MADQVNSAATDVVPDGVNDGGPDGGIIVDINSGNYFQIGGTDSAKDPVTIGLGAKKDVDGKPIRLTGCTDLIVMSQKAVWFGHFWETLSYGDNEIFQTQVLDFLTSDGNQNSDVQQSLSAHADDFKDQPSASAWIVYPVADDIDNGDGTTTPADYKNMNTKLQDELKQLTGIMATMTLYTPSDASAGALGRALYQYDPEVQAEDPKRGFRFIHEYANEGTTFF